MWYGSGYYMQNAMHQLIQIDNTNNHNLRAPKQDDLNDSLRTYIDDPNNEVKTYSDSLYISTEEIENVLKQNDNKFFILSLNIQSLNSKYDSLTTLLSQLYEKNLKFKAICLQETWLSAEYDTSIFNIPGYSLIHHGKICSQHSELIIYLSDEFSFTFKDIEIDSNLWDGQFVEVNGRNLNGKLTLGNIYRPPRFNNTTQHWRNVYPN